MNTILINYNLFKSLRVIRCRSVGRRANDYIYQLNHVVGEGELWEVIWEKRGKWELNTRS